MLVARGLRKSYRTREVVRDFGLTLDAGEVVGLLGPNGAGKTTCFYMIVGLVPADAGQIVLDGRDITGEPMYTRARLGVGYLPQEPSVFRKLSVADNLRLVLELRDDLDRQRARARARQRCIDELQIAPRRRPDRRQPLRRRAPPRRNRPRAGRQAAPDAARRTLRRRRPDLGRRDPAHRAPPQDRAGIGVLITDHNVRETLGICDRAYILNEGSVLAQGAPDALLANPDVRRVYLGEAFRL